MLRYSQRCTDAGPRGKSATGHCRHNCSRTCCGRRAESTGSYLFDACEHRLRPVGAGDIRALALTPGQRGIDAQAPVHLIYVADLHRLTHTAGFQEPGLHDPEIQKSYYFVDTGLIAGNVYLFAAAAGLASWFHNCDKDRLAGQLGLRKEQRVLFAHSLGYPERD
jgi:nitroreductase